MIRIPLAGQTMELLPQRALLWLETETLIITDPHFGKGASFRASGVPVPAGSTQADLLRLARLLDLYCPRRLLILGDFFHSAASRTGETLEGLRTMRSAFAAMQWLLIRGNHDLHAGDPPEDLDFEVSGEPYLEGRFAFCHFPQAIPEAYALAGHLHPGIKLTVPSGQKLGGPCFYFGAEIGLLPAFGSFTGTAPIAPLAGDRVYLLGPDQVVPIPPHLAEACVPDVPAWRHP